MAAARKGVRLNPDGTVLSCVFCDIVAQREAHPEHAAALPTTAVQPLLHKTPQAAVFWTRSPAASVHFLSCPLEHVANIDALLRRAEASEAAREHAAALLGSLKAALDAAMDAAGAAPERQYGFHRAFSSSISHLHLHGFGHRAGERPPRRFGFTSLLAAWVVYNPALPLFMPYAEALRRVQPAT